MSENIIEIFFIGEKELTLKIEYNKRILFSEDYVIDVQASSVYYVAISVPFVIIGLILAVVKLRSKN